MKKLIAIDLGTSYSEVVQVSESGAIEVIPNLDGDLKTPSVVSWASGKAVVGKAAMPDLVLAPEHVIKLGKRFMGKVTDNGKPINLLSDPSGEQKTAVDSSAAILNFLKKSAEQYLGCKVECGVITVPAYFDEIARKQTVAAAKIAGFLEVRLLEEPISAALHYGLEKANDETIVVIDIGGGTTDVTVLEISNKKAKAIFTTGDAELGGANWDEAILKVMVQKAKEQKIEISPDDLPAFYHNLDKAREAKEMLSRRDKVTLVAEVNGKRCGFEFTRQMLKEVAAEFDQRVISCCKKAADKVAEKVKKIDKALLVGGSSRLFHMPEMVQSVFGIEPSKDTDPDFVICRGAAIWAEKCFGEKSKTISVGGNKYLASEVEMEIAAAHAICIAAMKDCVGDDRQEYNYQIIPANEPLPCEFSEDFAPVNPSQKQVTVKLVQGEPGQPSSNSTLLRKITVPIKPSAEHADRINVKVKYNEQGLLELTVMDELLGKPVSDSFIYSAGLSDAEINEMKIKLNKESEGTKNEK